MTLAIPLALACSGQGAGSAGAPAGPGPSPGGLDQGLGAAPFQSGELDASSRGGTITFQQIGAPGWYPRVGDPAVGPCDVTHTSSCCRNTHTIAGDALTPWDEELILTLRGPMEVKQLAVYQPAAGGDAWRLVSAWDRRAPGAGQGLAFAGNGTEAAGFGGAIGTECLVDVATALPFACGAGSDPYCPPASKGQHRGWSGSKLLVLLARMPHAGAGGPGVACSTGTQGGWYDAPWIGLSVAELVRAGAFAACQCYAKDPANWARADGCGQFNVFEVVNDNNAYTNLGVFSTNLIGYAGYVGEGPCGPACDVSRLAADVDLIAKATDTGATAGALASPTKGPGAAFRRPDRGYRYFLLLLDVSSRTIQLGVVHPGAIPSAAGALLPALPPTVPAAAVHGLLDLRLPAP